MTADTGDNAADTTTNGSSGGDEGYTGTGQAARALNNVVSPKTIIRMVDRGELEGKRITSGRSRNKMVVSIASLKRLRDQWVVQGKLKKEELIELNQAVSTSSDETDAIARAFENIAREYAESRADNAVLSERNQQLQLEAKAASTKEDELRVERERRERAELEAERLKAELAAERERRRPKGLLGRLFGG